VLTSTSDSAEAWTSELSKLVARVSQLSVDNRRAAHYKWWDDFWNRSSINILGGLDGKAVSDGYALQRFIDACGGRGGFPIKTNGSIFTVDGKEGENQFDADYRRGGGPYRFQNTRLIYWPMLASGDSDLMLPFFRMYRESLMLAERRTRTYFSHEGGFFPETMYFFGAYPDSVYGWNRSGKQPSYVENPSVRNAFQGSLELLAMMLEYNAYNGDKRFVRDTLTPVAEAVLQFYDKHYPRDDKGMLRITPGQALDTWQNASNPLPDIAGLRFVLNALNTQKISLQRPASQAAKRLLQQLPDLPTRKVNGRTVLLPAAETSGEAKGTQNPELYAVFPYRFYGVNKPDLEIGRATFEARRFKNSGPEADDPIQAAFLGITRTAQQNVVENFAAQPSGRFPAFWGPNTGWTPDQAPGHIAMLTLQSMLLQSDGNKMVVFPAWPKNWDVEFKLHAPQNTTIEGVYRAGKIEKLTVTPDKRSADVVKMEPE
jgi:hypothetical protein